MIWVAGEALIDLLPSGPVPGGGPANTAIALARLGQSTNFIGGLSSDDFGQVLRENLTNNGVNLDLSMSSALPTALAKVSIGSDGSAGYDFVLENTATFSFALESLPSGSPQVLHIGSLATVVEPSATHLFQWASKIEAPIVFDPNIRPAVITDVNQYRECVEQWAQISTVIKLSDDDLHFLYPQMSEPDALAHLMSQTCRLIVLTKGADGVVGVAREGVMEIPGVVTSVVDTIGAGDTVGAVLVEALARGRLLFGADLEAVLKRAVRAAAITCSRAGCNPPTRNELDEYGQNGQ